MNIKHISVMAGAVQLIPMLAHAQPQGTSAESSFWGNLFWGLLPLIFILVFFVIFIRKLQKPIFKRSQQHMERQVQHMERVEQSLDRIAKLLEKKN